MAGNITLGVVDSAKKSAESSVAGYAETLRQVNVEYSFDNDGEVPTIEYLISNATVATETPTNCTVTLTNGNITLSGCKVSSYSSKKTCSFSNEKATCE